jgi:hypothetical protein
MGSIFPQLSKKPLRNNNHIHLSRCKKYSLGIQRNEKCGDVKHGFWNEVNIILMELFLDLTKRRLFTR